MPDDTRLYLCHDYETATRHEFSWLTTVAEERTKNVHLAGGVDEEAFVHLRQERDRELAAPRLLLPSVQFRTVHPGHRAKEERRPFDRMRFDVANP